MKEGIMCKGCGKRQSKMPSSWILDDCCFYCPQCWEAFACRICGHHDPKGYDFKGSWNCRACRHKRQVKEKAGPSHQALQQLIIDESLDLCDSASPQVAKSDAVEVLKSLETDSEDEDVLCDLPGQKLSKPSAKVRHIVLLVDASGSMRTEDVEVRQEGSQISRLEAAELCCRSFLEEHARSRPQDVFSVLTFHESATVVVKRISSGELRAIDFQERAAKGTFYLKGLQKASELLDSEPGELILLSDGRPADTKQALEYFQEHFMAGPLRGSQLHGIGFGRSVESFVALQQLACLTGGSFVLSGSSMLGLCKAFSSVSSTITCGTWVMAEQEEPKRELRQVSFELPEVGVFGKKHVVRFRARRSSFSYDGQSFERQRFAACEVLRRSRPYMRGGMRLVYGFQDLEVTKNGSWMVAKSSRYLSEAHNSLEAVECHAKSTAVARFFAARFNGRLKALDAKHVALLFVPCFVYELENEPLSSFAAERYLPGVFLKYNSNNGYVAEALPHNDTVQSFMHFTFEESGGNLMVTDLQGVARDAEVLLTDPQVLSLSREYGSGDLGAAGYLRCLRAHRCGPSCRQLGLAPLGSKVRSMGSESSWQHVQLSSDWERLSEGTTSSASSWMHVQHELLKAK